MTLSDEILLNYAEGNLDTDADEHIAQLLETDAPARERLRLIQLSGDALASETSQLSLVPEEDQLVDAIFSGNLDSHYRHDSSDSAHGTVSAQGEIKDANYRFRSSWRLTRVAAALGFLAIGLAGGYFSAARWPSAASEQSVTHPTWLVRIVDYHTLYGRETVALTKSSAQQVKSLKQRFSRFLKHPVTIPDLQVEHLEFKRGQVLMFDSEPIIQLVYLPENEGRPVALCLKSSVGKDRDMSFISLHGLGVVRWRQNNIEYVLVGDRAASLLRIAAVHSAAQIGGEQRI